MKNKNKNISFYRLLQFNHKGNSTTVEELNEIGFILQEEHKEEDPEDELTMFRDYMERDSFSMISYIDIVRANNQLCVVFTGFDGLIGVKLIDWF